MSPVLPKASLNRRLSRRPLHNLSGGFFMRYANSWFDPLFTTSLLIASALCLPSSGREPQTIVQAHHGRVRAICFSPDDRWFASVGDDEFLRIWKVPTAELIATLALREAPGFDVDVSPDGRFLAVGTGKGFECWSVEERNRVQAISSPNLSVNAIRYSTTGRVVAAAHSTGPTTVWNPKTGSQVASLATPSGGAASLSFSPDGKNLSCCTGHKTLTFWNTTDWTLTKSVRTKATATYVCFAPKGKALAFATLRVDPGRPPATQAGCAAVCFAATDDLTHYQIEEVHNSYIISLSFDRSASWLASTSNDSMILWKVDAHRVTSHMTLAGPTSCASLGRATRLCAVGMRNGSIKLFLFD